MVSQARQVAGLSLRNTITGSIVKRITHSLTASSCVQNSTLVSFKAVSSSV